MAPAILSYFSLPRMICLPVLCSPACFICSVVFFGDSSASIAYVLLFASNMPCDDALHLLYYSLLPLMTRLPNPVPLCAWTQVENDVDFVRVMTQNCIVYLMLIKPTFSVLFLLSLPLFCLFACNLVHVTILVCSIIYRMSLYRQGSSSSSFK